MRVSELKKEMDEQFSHMGEQFSHVQEQFAEVAAQFAQVNARFEQVDARFEQVDARFDQVDARFHELERRIAAEGEATRRHFDLVAEQFRAEVRLTLDKVMAVGDKADDHERSHVEESALVRHVLDDHEVRLKALEHRDR
jgi:septal ring factor EnvC (AmiA/AmiB activator)